MAYLPKAVEMVAGIGATTAVGATRPIMLKDNASKLLWSVLPALAADAVAKWASPAQRGMVRGRVPLLGAIEIDAVARCAAFCSTPEEPAVLTLLDFLTAFPNVDRQCILMVMAAAGFPIELVYLAAASWNESYVVDREGNWLYAILRGVGQECSAAALLFVIGVEPLLVALKKM